MARVRFIKPQLFENEILGTMDGDSVLLFTGLWCMADREGRLEDRPLRIKAKLFPYREVAVESSLTRLTESGFLIRYNVNGVSYIQIANWDKHQRPHPTEKKSEIPSFNNQSPLNNGESMSLKVEYPSDYGLLITDYGLPKKEEVAVVPNPLIQSADDFETFWNAYPEHRRTKKVTTQREWVASSFRLPPLQDILSALENHKRSEKWQAEGGKYIPSPLNWLLEQEWHSKYPEAKKTTATPVKKPTISVPKGWKKYIQDNYPHKADQFDSFHELPENIQREISEELTEEIERAY